MRRLFILAALLMFSVLAFSTSIYDIQYTTVPGPGSNYPSLLAGQVVSTEGVVSGIGFTGGKYVITEGSGVWKGIFVNDPAHTPVLGDRVAITGTVNEVSGFTEIGSVTSYQVISSDNPIPDVVSITPQNLQYNTGEAYEGVLIRLTNVRVSVPPIGNQFTVTANNFSCQISNGFYPQPHTWSGIVLNQLWAEITGIVNYASGQFRTNPRSDNDMIPTADINTISLTAANVEAPKGETVAVNVTVSRLEEDWNLKAYRFKVGFNKRIVRFADVEIASTLSDTYPDLILSANEDSITVVYSSDNALASPTNSGVLIKLLFETLSYGETILDITQGSFSYTQNDIVQTVNASVLADGKIKVPIQKKVAWLSIWNNDNNKKNIFNPWLNQKITIEYGSLVETGVPAGKAIIRIYDSQGRLVATPINKIITAPDGIEYLSWDGRDRNKNLLPIGLYYCHLEIIDRVTGKSETAVQPIVVAAKLK